MREPRFWQHPRTEGISLLPSLLAPAAWAWGLAGRARRRYTVPERVAVPVICVGNLSAGGTGKTPLALTIAERLIKSGKNVHFLTRGYGGRKRGPSRVDLTSDSARDVGDEPLLLAAVAPTWVSADRRKGAAAAVHAGAEIIIMDDGLQNPSLEKDFSILVIDAATGLGNGRLIPAGPLREPVGDAMARIDAVVIVGRGQAADDLGARARDRALPVFRATLRAAPSPRLDGASVLAFTGIGRPEKFYATLRELRADIVDQVSFPDHHPFSERDAERLLARARELDAKLVTTEKDRARLLHAPAGSARAQLLSTAETVSVSALICDFPSFEALIHNAVVAARGPVRP